MKYFLCWVFLSAISSLVIAQDSNTALLIIDIQDFYFQDDKMPLEGNLEATQNARLVLEHFRENELTVIHIMHYGGGDIHPLLKPEEDEIVLVKNQINAFRGTGLDSLLKANNISGLVILGMQTQMCLEAATRAGADLGYQCTVIHDACASRDLEFQSHIVKAKDVHFASLNTLKAYAIIISAKEYISD